MFVTNYIAVPILFLIFYCIVKFVVVFITRKMNFKRRKVGYSKTCLITGGSRGIGLEIGKLFLEDEYNLVIVARNLLQLRSSVEELRKLFPKNKIDFIQSDLSTCEGVKKLIEDMETENLEVDALVNNAGRYVTGFFENKNVDEWINMIKLNNLATVRLTHYCLKGMIRRKFGQILTIGSFSGFSNAPRIVAYCSTKSFLRGFSKCLFLEMGIKHPYIQVTISNPGFVKTKLLMDSGFKSTWSSSSPLMTAEKCAYESYGALMRGEREIVLGFHTKFLLFGYWFFFPTWFSDFVMNVATKSKN